MTRKHTVDRSFKALLMNCLNMEAAICVSVEPLSTSANRTLLTSVVGVWSTFGLSLRFIAPPPPKGTVVEC